MRQLYPVAMLLLLLLCAHSLQANRLRTNFSETKEGLTLERNKTETRIDYVESPAATTSDSATVTITRQPSNILWCTSKQPPIDLTYTIEAVASNGTLTYQWQTFDGTNWSNITEVRNAIVGTTSPTIEIHWPQQSTFTIRCAVTVTSQKNSLTVYSTSAGIYSPGIPGVRYTSPKPEYVCVGSDLTLSVTGIGRDVTYQWSATGVGNPQTSPTVGDNATSTSITLTNIQPNQEGYYNCSVTNACGTASTDVYYLGVGTTPAITTQPPSTSAVQAGSTVLASITPSNYWGLKYQWFKNGITQAVAGATDATLTLANAASADAGSYVCKISNQCGSVFSQPFVLSVTTPEPPSVTITSQPTDFIICPKQTVASRTFSVRATATNGTLSYQWQALTKDTWVNLSDDDYINNGSKKSTVSINDEVPWGYTVRCMITATGNRTSTTVYSSTAMVTGGVVPTITSNPKGPEYVCVGGSLTLFITAIGKGLTYQWSGRGTTENDTLSTLTLTNIQPEQDDFYYCTVTGSCGSFWSDSYYLGVSKVPVVETQPASALTVKVGATATAYVKPVDDRYMKYQWFKNGTTQAVAGATDATLTLANATSADAGSYVCRISNQCGSVFSQPFVLSVTTPEPPTITITSQPSNYVTCPKQGSFGASFSVRALATNGTLSYQWQTLEGNTWTNLTEQQYLYEGTTTPNLTIIKDVPFGYTVRCIVTATNNGTSTTVYSNSALTKLYNFPGITSGPTGPDYVCEGGSLTLSVTATGEELSYQWTKDGIAIPGATSSSLVLTNIKSSDVGYYVCTVNNLCAGFYSPGYYLSIAKFPTIRQQPPATKSICTTEALSLCVDTEGGSGFYTQWQTRSGAAAAWVDVDASIAGAGGDPYSGAQRCLSRLPFLTDGQQYRLKFYVPNCSDVLYSTITTLQGQSGIAITTQPSSSSAVCRGTNVSATVVATGQNLTYQWYKGSTLVSGSTTATLKLNNIQTGQAGVYTVKITNACGSVTSQPFTISVTGSAPAISTTYASLTACEGSPLQVAKPVTSDANVTYQWLKGGQSIGAADNIGSLSFASVSVSDGGNYSVRVTNGCGSTTSTPFTLTVLNKAVITGQPLDAVVGCGSTSASFAVSATGQNLTYQWESRDNASAAWQPISNTGVATAQLTVPPGLVSNGRQFRVGVSSATCPGMVYSNPATLTLKSPLVFTQQPTDFAICSAGTARFSMNVNNNGGGAVSIRWEYSDGNGWVTASGSGFSGNTTGNFYVSGTQLVNGRRFRAVAKVAACPAEVASSEAVLRVDAQYAPTLSGVTPNQTIRSGGTIQGISASASGGSGALKITWTRNTISALNFNPALAQSGTSADFPIVRTVTSTTNSNQSLVFTLRVTDGVGCVGTALSKVTIQPAVINTRLGMDAEESVAALTLYPNPSSGRLLYVRGRQIKPETIVLYNLTGVAQPTSSRLLDEERVEVKPQTPLEKGLYVLTLQQGDTVRHYRVVIE